jgi:hypothetical protein
MSITNILNNLLYILIFGCLFLYIGLKRNNISKDTYKGLFIFGIFLIIYFFIKIFTNEPGDNIVTNFLYLFLVAPLIVFIGIKGTTTSIGYYNILAIIAFFIIIYHSYKLCFDE